MNPTASPIVPRWLSPSQLARRWGVHPETILRLIRAGRLPALRVNARVLKIAEVEAAAHLATQAKLAQLPHLATKRG